MKEVELFIKLPKKVYEKFGHEYSEESRIAKDTNEAILDAFIKGIVLPEGHGKIVDVNDLYLDITTITTDDGSGNEMLDVVLKEDIDNAHAIIEADAPKIRREEV